MIEAMPPAETTGHPGSPARATQGFDRLLMAVCHEVRTPLTALTGALNLLGEAHTGALSPDQQGFVQMAVRNARRIDSLVSSLLASGRAARGEWPVDPVPSNLARLVRGGVEDAVEMVGIPGAQVIVEVAPELPLVPSDPDGVRRVVKNLVANSIRFSPRDQAVRVRVRIEGTDAVVEVVNRGAAIPAAEREWIFGRFHQMPAERGGRPRGGLGLGLFLSREIARAHGGDLRCTDPPDGTGACFRVVLPVAPAPEPGRGTSTRSMLRVTRRDGTAMRAADTFHAADALEHVAPEARRWELPNAVVAALPETPAAEAQAAAARLTQVIGPALQVELTTGGEGARQ